ncbi:helix-turn-helix domain-containing protein [Streptomyces graminofaciens]|uniref:helix-turn-helix domain-containing protein n=1 Tax=Streptomyces graminofaciens TaxID=68212 RepID=UPI0025728189|nr:helix-turn-helix domain-containing protein [Streptomyces graminofaciens]
MTSATTYETHPGLPETIAAVPEALRPWFAGVESPAASEGPLSPPDDSAQHEPYTYVPDAATKLVVRTDADGRRDVVVVGPRTRASYYASRRPASCVQLRLEPGTARPLLGVPATDLLDRVVRLADLPALAARQLAAELRTTSAESIVPHLARALPDQLPPPGDSRTGLLRAAVEAMSPSADHRPDGVRELARRLAVSERQLRNLFADGVGVSPKLYARIARVRHLLAHRSPAVPWAQLATATGYYDQSHMTADFRTLMGVPPTSYFTGRLPAAQPCRPLDRAQSR